MSNLSNKVALITGGCGLLGQEHCKALLEKGAIVYSGDINLSKSDIFLNERNYRQVHLDVTSENSIKLILKQILDQDNRVDILINNAAIDSKVGKKSSLEFSRLENFSLLQWNREIEVGLTGAFLCSKVLGNHFAQNGGGVILNIASDLSVISPDQRLYLRDKNCEKKNQPVKPITYSVIKAALVGLTKYLSTYWLDGNVRANALSPGGVYINQDEEFVLRLNELIPLGRMAQPDEYISAVQFLCSDASAYMNGQNIVIDGGRSII